MSDLKKIASFVDWHVASPAGAEDWEWLGTWFGRARATSKLPAEQ